MAYYEFSVYGKVTVCAPDEETAHERAYDAVGEGEIDGLEVECLGRTDDENEPVRPIFNIGKFPSVRG